MNSTFAKCALVAVAFLAGSAAQADSDTSHIVVRDVWSRPATGTAVIYATLDNTGADSDRLIGASSPVAKAVELHESEETKMPGMSSPMAGMPAGDSMMTMKSLTAIPIAPRSVTKLSPGGYHLMLDLRRDLKPGETIPLRLHFSRAGWIATTAQVRPIR